MGKRVYSPLLALAGLSVGFIFTLFGAVCVYGSANLLIDGGFWQIVAGLTLIVPAIWSAYLGAGVICKTVVDQP